jgi:hypothetical protein
MVHDDIFNIISGPEVLFIYKGEVNTQLAQSILCTLESDLTRLEHDIIVRKRLYSILVECIQNILHHGEINELALVVLTVNEKFYSIRTGNVIFNTKVSELKEWLEVVNILSGDELKASYKKMLAHGNFSLKGTAGLGFIEIARKSAQNIGYSFKPLNDQKSIFSFTINVPKINSTCKD